MGKRGVWFSGDEALAVVTDEVVHLAGRAVVHGGPGDERTTVGILADDFHVLAEVVDRLREIGAMEDDNDG